MSLSTPRTGILAGSKDAVPATGEVLGLEDKGTFGHWRRKKKPPQAYAGAVFKVRDYQPWTGALTGATLRAGNFSLIRADLPLRSRK